MPKDTHYHIPPNKELAIQLAKRQLAEFVYDAVNLEGINLTLPEVQTLLDGITVGGHKIEDQEIALNQIRAWRLLFSWVEAGQFSLSADAICRLHLVAGQNEALEAGSFRTSKDFQQ